jgi:hypothetical protein
MALSGRAGGAQAGQGGQQTASECPVDCLGPGGEEQLSVGALRDRDDDGVSLDLMRGTGRERNGSHGSRCYPGRRRARLSR